MSEKFDKVQFKAYISRKIDEQFRIFITNKHKIYARGTLSFEVEQALQNYMANEKLKLNGQSLLITAQNNPAPKIFKLKQEIMSWLKANLGYEEVYNVNIDHFMAALKALRGIDPRTYRKWEKLLLENGCIKFIYGGKIVEFT